MNHALLVSVLLFSVVGLAQQPEQSAPVPAADVFQDVSTDHHHLVTTKSAEAQRAFDQGLQLIYAFNYGEAENFFRRAAALDPNMAMAYWGMAYAMGTSYYMPANAVREEDAQDAIQHALALSANGSEVERAYIQTLAKRYSPALALSANGPDFESIHVEALAKPPNSCPYPNRQRQAAEFRNAMRALTQSYPDDLDAATLYAHSIMNMNPGRLWNADGTPREGTAEIVAVLESVLKRDPRHIGAVHYYIHAVEGSPNPERALAFANTLPSLAPTIGHLVHMPAHIYLRTGDYSGAEDASAKAAQVDEHYIRNSSAPDVFTVMSYIHNLYFISTAASMSGHFSAAKEAADKLVALIGPHLNEMPHLEAFLIVPATVLVRFNRWDDILKLPQPVERLKIANTVWHFARGMAFAATGKLMEAEAEHQAVTKALDSTPFEEVFAMPPNNKTREILLIAVDVLAAKLAMARNERSLAIAQLRDAVAVQDALKYGEPPSWFYPVRESLGAAIFLDGNISEAEKLFREDLQRNPSNPRSLFGLQQALKARGRAYEAGLVQHELSIAWKSDVQLLNLSNF